MYVIVITTNRFLLVYKDTGSVFTTKNLNFFTLFEIGEIQTTDMYRVQTNRQIFIFIHKTYIYFIILCKQFNNPDSVM